MSERVIKTGLSKKYKDMLDAVIGQMSDGYWENIPMMRGYWKFVKTGTAGDDVTLNVDEASGARYGDSRIVNHFYGMSDDAVKKFFADKIKFLIKEEGLGKWDRSNESKTDYLSHGEARYRVKDCYYAYEILKGRNARRHPEYDDVAESKHPVKIKLVAKANESFESALENIAQSSGEIDYGDAMALDRAAAGDKEIRKKVRDLIMDWRGAAEDGDDDGMANAAKALKALADSLPKSEARKHPEYNDVAESAVDEGKAYTFTWWDNEPTAERRPTTRADLKNCLHKETFNAADDDDALKTAVEYLCEYIGDDPEDVAATPKKIWDYFDDDWGFGDPIPMVLKQGSRVIKDSGFDPRKGDESRKNESSLETRLEDVAQVAGVIDYGDAMRLDRAAASDKDIRKKVRNLLADFDDAAYDEDEAAMEKVAQQLKELADSVPENSNESFEGWDGWEEVEGLEDTIDGIENLTYELRSCVRGAKTHCKDWKSLALYIKGLAANLDDAAELMAYRQDESKKKNPSKKFSSTVEEDEDGKKKSH